MNRRNFRRAAARLSAVVMALSGLSVSHADINKDGKADLLWQNYGYGQIGAWLLNGSSVTFSSNLSWTCGLGDGCSALWRPVGPIGDSRILWHNADTGVVSSWLLSGTTVTGKKDLAATCGKSSGCSQSWKAVGTGNFHSSNYHGGDILWHNASTGDVGVWFVDDVAVEAHIINWKCGSADGCSSYWKVVGVSRHPEPPAILWHNATTGELRYWYLADTPSLHPTPPNSIRFPYYTTVLQQSAPLSWTCGTAGGCSKAWTVIGLDDVDYDGHDDVIWFNSQTGEVAAWLLNGTTVKGTLSLSARCTAASSCSTTWYPIGVMTGSTPPVH